MDSKALLKAYLEAVEAEEESNKYGADNQTIFVAIALIILEYCDR